MNAHLPDSDAGRPRSRRHSAHKALDDDAPEEKRRETTGASGRSVGRDSSKGEKRRGSDLATPRRPLSQKSSSEADEVPRKPTLHTFATCCG